MTPGPGERWDIVDRLNSYAREYHDHVVSPTHLLKEAAREIETLRSHLEEAQTTIRASVKR